MQSRALQGELAVTLVDGHDLPVWGFPWQSNPYCRLTLGTQARPTVMRLYAQLEAIAKLRTSTVTPVLLAALVSLAKKYLPRRTLRCLRKHHCWR
jgi:hypothetical protein